MKCGVRDFCFDTGLYDLTLMHDSADGKVGLAEQNEAGGADSIGHRHPSKTLISVKI